MTTHYQSSKGPKAIADMPLRHATNALDRLQRERVDASRDAEIEAIAAHVAKLSEEIAEAQTSPAVEATEATAEKPNERAVIGGNNPPEPTTFEAIKTHLDDLLIEVRNWADGAKVESQAQADEIARLLEEIRKAEKAADDARQEEVRPLDDQRNAIQARYNAYIAPLKNKQPGKLPLAAQALKATLQPWLQRLEDEKRAEAERLRKEAEEKAKAAAEAARAAATNDFGATEEAEELIADAIAADVTAKRAESAKAHAQGDTRAIGLRSYFTPTLTDPKAALAHYVRTYPEDVKAFLMTLARQDVQAGKRTIPGFDVIEERRVA